MEQQQDLLQEVEEEIYFERASAGMRFVNYLVDIIAFYALYFITFFIIGTIYATNRVAYNESLSYDRDPFILSTGFIYMVAFSLFLIYYTVLEGATKGRTLGKLITLYGL